MKSTILNLKKRVLVISGFKSDNIYEQYDEIKNSEHREVITSKKYKFICVGSELSEEIADDLVDCFDLAFYVDYNGHSRRSYLLTAFDSFISAIEANGYYWSKNPLGEEPNHLDYKFEKYKGEMHFISERHKNEYSDKWELWQEAESKTFHPDRTLIFEIL